METTESGMEEGLPCGQLAGKIFSWDSGEEADLLYDGQREHRHVRPKGGGVLGVAGCLKHTSIITKSIEDAKKNSGDLAVLWLDLTKAYGRIQDQCCFRSKDTIIPVSVREQTPGSLEKSGLLGKYKAWGYQHGEVPRLLWPLLVYEVPVSTVEGLERKINTYLRRWLVVPRSFCSIGLYSTGSKLQLPVTSMLEEYKVTKTHQAMMLQDSNGERVCQAGIVVRTVAQGRLGLGCFTRMRWSKADPKEHRSMVQREVRKSEEETQHVKAVALKKTGQLDKVGGRTRKGSDMAGYLDHGRTSDKILDVFCLQCPAYSIKPPYLGDGG
ncbi:Peptide chain release factor 1 [Labeo rohita]|uniref:Peptide chain release factor 1 n=1 Tax=Labeo rohita TaxID=84645 RepID=A0ABQ8L0Y1_LABRO|nr:Peptide chain release factor 1 [Labeo rohita]